MPMLPLAESFPPTIENPRDFFPSPFWKTTVWQEEPLCLRGNVQKFETSESVQVEVVEHDTFRDTDGVSVSPPEIIVSTVLIDVVETFWRREWRIGCLVTWGVSTVVWIRSESGLSVPPSPIVIIVGAISVLSLPRIGSLRSIRSDSLHFLFASAQSSSSPPLVRDITASTTLSHASRTWRAWSVFSPLNLLPFRFTISSPILRRPSLNKERLEFQYFNLVANLTCIIMILTRIIYQKWGEGGYRMMILYNIWLWVYISKRWAVIIPS